MLLFCSIALFLSCSDRRVAEYDKGFGDAICIKADSVGMGVIIKPGNIYVAKPYVVVSNIASPCDRHFAVFNQELEYLYSFCGNGTRPQECVMPSVAKNMPEGKFMVRDHATGKYHTYELTDSCAIALDTFTPDSAAPEETNWEINHIRDNVYLTKGTTARKNVRRLIDFNTGQCVDSLPQTFNLRETMGDAYYSEFDDCWIVSSQDSFACAYFFINRIEFGTVSDNKLQLTAYVGADRAPEFYRYTDEKLSGKYEYNVDYNVVYYEWMAATGNRIYASYFGRPWGDISAHSSIIESYTCAGTPCDLYELDVPVSSFILLEDRNMIVGLNCDRSEDFYTYNLNQL